MTRIAGGHHSAHTADMTITEELPAGPQPEGPQASPEPAPPSALHRRTSSRLVAGVCGGIADRFEIDVTVVRVAFVVAACLWGAGVVLYLALWALVPTEGATGRDPALDALEEPSGPPWVTYVLLTAALFLGLVISTSWWGGPAWGGGLGLAWLVVLFVVVVVALRRPARRFSLGRALLTLTLVALSFVILAVGTFFAALAMTGVPLTGGIGQRVVQPISAAELRTPIRLAAGNLTVDLTRVPLGTATRTVTASVAVGELVVDVPRGVVVDVNAHSGIGTVSYGDAGPAAFAVPMTTFGPARPQLVVDAQAGIGRVELVRTDS